MKKKTIRNYSIIAFVVLPIVIVLLGVLAFLFIRRELSGPTFDKDEITADTVTGELYEVLTVTEADDIYVIYAIDNFYQFTAENKLVAFHGTDMVEISDTIRYCDYGAYALSYWEGQGELYDFSVTEDFIEYLDLIQSYSYQEGKEPDWAHVTAEFSKVTTYDLGDYMGYEHTYNNGIGLLLVFLAIAVAVATMILLGLELLVAIILKCTVFKGERRK